MSAPFRIDLRDVSTFPTRRDEAWRYSDFRRATPGPVALAPELATPADGGPFASMDGAEIVFANGRTADGETALEITSTGGVQRLRFVTDAANAGWQASVTVTIKAGADLLLLETYEGAGSAYVATAALTFVLEEGARLERIVLLDEPADAVSVSTSQVQLTPGAHFAQTVVLTGARLQRHETHVTQPGGGATVRMDGVYVLNGSRHSDLTTTVIHHGLNGETSQVVKGVATDAARGVFQGQIVVAEGADKTDARMRHDALLLSDRAEIDAKPELEISADDVQCAHGNTIGALNPEAIFYARSRGIPEVDAKILLTQAFLGEAVERIGHDGAREIVAAWVEKRLEGLNRGL
jgi:Fe-S cluster assembly protein SufD